MSGDPEKAAADAMEAGEREGEQPAADVDPAGSVTAQLMQNPGMMAALRSTLDGMIGSPSGYIEVGVPTGAGCAPATLLEVVCQGIIGCDDDRRDSTTNQFGPGKTKGYESKMIEFGFFLSLEISRKAASHDVDVTRKF